MSGDALGVTVRILDKEFRIACPREERDDLLEAARFLDGKMREIRDSRKVIGTDRIAVMAALNITHELLQVRNSGGRTDNTVVSRINKLQDRIETALQKHSQLEL